MKTCTLCGETKPLSDYGSNRRTKSGVQARCKRCTAKYARAWRKANPGSARASVKKWASKNPEIVRAGKVRNLPQSREYGRRKYWEDPVAKREASDAWRCANPEKVREKNRQWQRANPEYFRAKNHRRRAVVAGANADVFDNAEIYDRDNWICQLCHEPVDQTLRDRNPMMASLDHIVPISKGGHHTRNNVQCSHLRCNISKGARV